MLARVFITPKSGVLDPQGKAVATSLRMLGFERVSDVRVGKYIEIELEESDRDRAAEQVRSMCERLLANAVIEDFAFDLAEGGRSAGGEAERGE